MDGSGIWDGDLELEGEGKVGRVVGKVFEIGDGGGGEDARLPGEGGVTEGETKE